MKIKNLLLLIFVFVFYKDYSQNTCATAIPLTQAGLPYTSGTLTSCGSVNNYGVGAGACNTTYGGGEDYVYSLAITSAPVTLSFNVGGAGTWKICQVFNGCPSPVGAPTNCIGNVLANPNGTGNITFPSTGTYYVVMDTWPAPTCGIFTLGISVYTPPGCPASLGPVTSIPSIPYTNAATTCGQVNNITSTNALPICGSTNYYNEEDAVYTFTPTSTGTITINLATASSWSGLMLYNGCPFSGTAACVATSQSSTGPKTMCASVTAGVPYTLIIDSWTGGTCLGAYTLNVTNCSSAPVAGTTVATPNIRCSNFTTTLTLSGAATTCGLTYQWQSGPAAIGPWANIAGATASTATFAVTALNTYFRCILTCGSFTSASAVAGTTITPVAGCGICGINNIPALPYSTTGQTTCGQVDDITSANVTNVCGSALYYGGEDAVYSFTPAASGPITIQTSGTGSFLGIMLYQNCPISGGTCVGNAQSGSGSQNLCVSVTAGQVYYLVIDSWPSPTCNPYNLSITAPTGTTAPCNMAYTVTSVPYSFDVFAGTVCPSTDDVLFTNIINFGFPFCYDGAPYTDGYIASNSSFVFDALVCQPNVYFNQIAAPGIGTGWSITLPAPSLVSGTSSTPQNAILGPWHDIHPGLGGTIRYTTLGATPNRRFVCSWENIPMFSCGTASPGIYFTGQIKLFETSNNIEIHVGQKRVCPGWNNGEAILGLENSTGTIYRPPVNMTAHNAVGGAGPYNQWIMTSTAYRWATTCGSGGTCLVLPINFKAFYCQRIDKINQINWETAVEENVKIFKVERSTDAKNFTEIASVNPKNQPSKYTIEDKTATPGVVNYYRVVAYEKNGQRTATYIYPLGATEGEVSAGSIYPNPVQGSFSIGIDSKILTTATMVIYDAFGKIVKSYSQDVGTGVTPITMKVDELSAGIYILEITDTKGQIISQQKLIKLNN